MTDQINRIMAKLEDQFTALGYRRSNRVVIVVLEDELGPEAAPTGGGSADPPAGALPPAPAPKPAPAPAGQCWRAAAGVGAFPSPLPGGVPSKIPPPSPYKVMSAVIHDDHLRVHLYSPNLVPSWPKDLDLYFGWNRTLNRSRWEYLLAVFLGRLEVPVFHETDDLIGKTLWVFQYPRPEQVYTIDGMRELLNAATG